MQSPESLIDQLEGALASKDISKRAETLRRVTDLFALGSARLKEDDVVLFGDVMSRLVEGIELAARAAFGSRIAMIPGAPTKIARLLEFNDAIDVAAPVLTYSEQLDEETLVENARTKSQGHLLANSGRKTLATALTDVLVDRGNPLVVTATAKNPGARFLTSDSQPLFKNPRLIPIWRCASGRGRTYRAKTSYLCRLLKS